MTALMICLAALVAVARFYPRTPIGRMMRDLVSGRWHKALPLAVVLVGLGLLLTAAPEVLPLAAGLDISLLADIVLAASAVLVQLNIRRLRHMARRGARIAAGMIRALRRPRARRTRQPALRRRPSRSGDDAPAGLRAWA